MLIHAQYTTVLHRPLLELVDRLGEVLPDGLDRMLFANSGSEAIEARLQLARQTTRRPNVIVFHGGLHGRTVAAASMTTSGTKFKGGSRLRPDPTSRMSDSMRTTTARRVD